MNNLAIWKIEKYLTPHETTCLTLGVDPDNTSTQSRRTFYIRKSRLNGNSMKLFDEKDKQPIGYVKLFDRLINDIKWHVIRMDNEAIGDDMTHLFNCETLLPNLSGFNITESLPLPEQGISVAPLRTLPEYTYSIKQSAIKQWLTEQGIHSYYFHGEVEAIIKDDNGSLSWDLLLINPPQQHSDTFEKVKLAVKKLLKNNNTAYPNADQLIEELGLSSKNEKANLRKAFKRYCQTQDK